MTGLRLEFEGGERAAPATLLSMDSRVYDWNEPTAVEVAIGRKLEVSELPPASLERLREVRTSIEQMRRDCKRLAVFA